MPIRIAFATDSERLAQALGEDLCRHRAERRDPFLSQRILVPNANVRHWLELQVARHNSVAIDLDFDFLETGLWAALRRLDSNIRDRGVPVQFMDRALLQLLILFQLRRNAADADAPPQAFARYLTGETGAVATRKQWQLAERLAGLLSEYEYNRPDWLRQWRDGGSVSIGTASPAATEQLTAQNALYRSIFGQGGLRDRLAEACGTRYLTLSEYAAEVTGPEQAAGLLPVAGDVLHIFGMSQLSAFHTELLFQLARAIDIRLYHFTVCSEFWEDVESLSEERRRRVREEDFARVRQAPLVTTDEGCEIDVAALENRLLQTWGRCGREALRLLSEYEERYQQLTPCIGDWLFDEHEAGSAPEDSRSETVLSTLQQQIRQRRTGTPGQHPDCSLQIVGCPSARREVEMVLNSIISNLRDDPMLKLTDIAVLVPDMRTYKPLFELVFDGDGRVPWNLVDSNAAHDSVFGQALLGLLELANGEFTRKQVFAVLLNPCFIAGTGVARPQVMQWLEWADRLHVFRAGRQQQHSTGDTPPQCEPFSWRQALRRLRFGRIMECDTDVRDNALRHFHDLVPYADMASGDAGEVGRFAAVVGRLFSAVAPLAEARLTVAQWGRQLHGLCDEFLAIPAERAAEARVQQTLFRGLGGLARVDRVADLDATVELSLLKEMVQSLLVGIPSHRGRYLSHGVSLASLRPMRPIPFRVAFVLGLGEGNFPGVSDPSTLDLRRYKRRIGDVTQADANRYLFLETLMTTRRKLTLSYVCADLQKEEERLPCSVIKQLASFLDQSILLSAQPTVELPLKGSSLRYLQEHVTGSEPPRPFTDVITNFTVSDRLLSFIALRQAAATDAASVSDTTAREYLDSANAIVDRYSNRLRLDVSEPPSAPAASSCETVGVSLSELARFLHNPLEASLRRHHRLVEEREDVRALAEDEPFFSGFPLDWSLVNGTLLHFVATESLSAALSMLEQIHAHAARCSEAPAGAFGALDVQRFAEEIRQRVEGGGAVKQGLATLCETYHALRCCQPVRMSAEECAAEAVVVPPLLLTVDDGQGNNRSIELTGSLPLGWCDDDGLLRATLAVCSTGTLTKSQPNRYQLEPFLFMLGLTANRLLPAGAPFTVQVAFRKGILARDYTVPDAQTSRLWLSELTQAFLFSSPYDLLPMPVIASLARHGAAGAPWDSVHDTVPGPQLESVAADYAQLLDEAVRDAASGSFSSYRQPELIRLLDPSVPANAFWKVRHRFRPLFQGDFVPR